VNLRRRIMEIAVTIVAGLILMTLIATWFDYLGKKARRADPDQSKALRAIEDRVHYLEMSLMDRDERIEKLEQDAVLMGKLLLNKGIENE
jgi:hypothetical protein